MGGAVCGRAAGKRESAKWNVVNEQGDKRWGKKRVFATWQADFGFQVLASTYKKSLDRSLLFHPRISTLQSIESLAITSTIAAKVTLIQHRI